MARISVSEAADYHRAAYIRNVHAIARAVRAMDPKPEQVPEVVQAVLAAAVIEAVDDECVVVSRHPATVEFVHREAPETREAPVVASATPEDVRGQIVYGNLPLHLACLAREVWAVEFSGAPPRGTEYTLADMDAAGAALRRYRVTAL